MSESARDALVERLFEAVLGFNDIYAVYLGERLGLYGALRAGPATAVELARATGLNERYVREWLEHQAVGGILAAENGAANPGARRYVLPPGHDDVLTNPDSPAYMAAFARMMVGIVQPLPQVLEAFRTGGGVPYGEYPPDFAEGQAAMNRVQFVNLLGSDWLPAIPDVDERLRPGARVADVACGFGWSSIALARAYPELTVDGFDLDEASVEAARANAASEGVGDRVRFQVADAAELGGAEYDLVLVIEAVHDMSRPVEALASMREMTARDGTVLVVDERAADDFAAPGDEVERLLYGWSILHCLPVGMADQPSAGTGTVMRERTLRAYAADAGYSAVEVLPIENDFWRFYRLTP